MLKINKIWIVVFLLLLLSLSTKSQNSTNSPYSRYGYGTISDRSFGAGRSMGGVGFGLRSSKQINPMNPASYSCMDSLTFLFDFGMTAQYSRLNDEGKTQKNLNGNLEYLAMQFPLTRRVAVSLGILPFTQVGYKYKYHNQQDNKSLDLYTGTGGFNEVYGGVSFDLWRKRLAFGVNVGYLFGTTNHTSYITMIGSDNAFNIQTLKKIAVSDMRFDLGVQYTHPLTKDERIVVGAVFSPGKRLKATAYDISTRLSENAIVGVDRSDTIRDQRFELPNAYGIGATYVKDNKWLVAADLSYQQWESAHFFDQTKMFNDRIKVALGGEYIPNNFTRSYFSRVRYRAGLHYNNSYLKIKEVGYKELGASVGVGFPMLDNRSYINASFEFVKVLPDKKSLINEQLIRFTVSYTFNEFWFFKRKLD